MDNSEEIFKLLSKYSITDIKKFCKSKHLNLTEREANILIFLNKAAKPVKISKSSFLK